MVKKTQSLKEFRLRKRTYPGKVLSVMNHKGGTAKSTSLELLALLRAKETGISPLLVDFDAQMNLSSALRYKSSIFPGNVGNVLHNSYDWSPAQVKENVCAVKFKGFKTPVHLIPGTLRLDEPMAALEHANRRDPGVVFRLREALHHVRYYYEYIFIDTSPAVGALAGDFALFASDVLLIPVGGLRSVLGLVEVLRRVSRNMMDRKIHGMAPLQVFIYAPHTLSDRTAAPFGEYNVRIGDWYPYLCDAFPQHFVRQVVGHSIQLPRAFKETLSLRALQGDRRTEYVSLASEIFGRIESGTTPSLGSLLYEGEIDLDAMEADIQAMIVAKDKAYQVRTVSFIGAK